MCKNMRNYAVTLSLAAAAGRQPEGLTDGRRHIKLLIQGLQIQPAAGQLAVPTAHGNAPMPPSYAAVKSCTTGVTAVSAHGM